MTDDEFGALIRPQPSEPEQPLPTRRQHARDDRVAHRRAAIGVLVTVALLLGGTVGAGWWAWSQYGEQIREFFGQEEIADFEGAGVEPEILITVDSGDIGEVVARKLFEAGVTASFEAVYNILLQDTSIVFQPGTYRLKTEMSAQSAINALRDPANRAEFTFTVIEGVRLTDALDVIAEAGGPSREELDLAVSDPTRYGVNPPFGGLEGYLFPATYTFDYATNAEAIVGEMVGTMVQKLEERGVPEADWHRILSIAAILEREARLEDDFYKVSRVIYNRLEPGSGVPRLQMDSTVTYWEETFDTVWTTDEARANPDNPYNTYYYEGLPAGPIALPGELALDAALSPAEGPWLYFVTWNMATGETFFSSTLAEHEANIALGKQCRDDPEFRDQCRQ